MFKSLTHKKYGIRSHAHIYTHIHSVHQSIYYVPVTSKRKKTFTNKKKRTLHTYSNMFVFCSLDHFPFVRFFSSSSFSFHHHILLLLFVRLLLGYSSYLLHSNPKKRKRKYGSKTMTITKLQHLLPLSLSLSVSLCKRDFESSY